MKYSGVEVGTVRPDQGVCLLVQPDGVEEIRIGEGAIDFSRQHRSKIDALSRSVFEVKAERERRDSFKSSYAMNFMLQSRYLRGSILEGGRPDCNDLQQSISSRR